VADVDAEREGLCVPVCVAERHRVTDDEIEGPAEPLRGTVGEAEAQTLPLGVTLRVGDLEPHTVVDGDGVCEMVTVEVRHRVGVPVPDTDTLRVPVLQGHVEGDVERVRVAQPVPVWEGERHWEGVGLRDAEGLPL